MTLPFEVQDSFRLATAARMAFSLTQHMQQGDAANWVAADIEDLFRFYLNLRHLSHAHVSLELLATDGCRLYHRDNVGIRLLCTYFGPGTEWAPRQALVHPDRGDDDSPRDAAGVLVRRSLLRHAGQGEVLLLKGKTWPGNSLNAAVHRSPPIAALGLTRLVLSIDACAHGG